MWTSHRTLRQIPGRKNCLSIEKIVEGGFDRVFLVITDDGREVIARIPFRNAHHVRYLTAREVVATHFLKHQPDLPVPNIVAWSFREGS